MTVLIAANPRRKRKSRKGRMPAGLARYWKTHRRGSRKSTGSSSRRRTRKSRRRSAPRVTVVNVRGNPSRSKRSRRSSRSYVRFKSVGRRVSGQLGNVGKHVVLPGAIGAAGALALDLSWGYIPLPASLQSGPLAPVARIALAVGIGVVAGKISGSRKFGTVAAIGAVTVTAYDLFKNYLQANTQLFASGGNAGNGSGNGPVSMFDPGTMGLYDRRTFGRRLAGLGYRSPAVIGRLGLYASNVVPYGTESDINDGDTF